MGKVMTKLKLTNIVDQGLAMQGLLRPDQIRSVEVDALVDTGATSLAIPADLAEIIPNPAHPDGWMIDLLSVA